VLVPAGHISIPPEIETGYIKGGHSGKKGNISQTIILSSAVGLSLEESVQELEGNLDLLVALLIGWLLEENLGIIVLGEALVKGAHIEVQALVNQRLLLDILGKELVVLAVLLHQIHHDSTRFPQGKAIIMCLKPGLSPG